MSVKGEDVARRRNNAGLLEGRCCVNFLRDEAGGEGANRVCKWKGEHSDATHFNIMDSKAPHAYWCRSYEPGMSWEVGWRSRSCDVRIGES